MKEKLTEKDLVKWKNPPKVADLLSDLEEARPFYSNHVTKLNEWNDNYNGVSPVKNNKNKNKSTIQPKLIRKQAEWRYASLAEPFLSNEDLFQIEPLSSTEHETAQYIERILNKHFRVDIDRINFIDNFIRHAVDEGTVVVKVTWVSEEEEVEEIVEEPVYATPEEAQMILSQAVQSGQMDENAAMQILQSGVPIPLGETKKIHKKFKEKINKPYLEVLSSRDVIVDPTCNGNPDKIRFIIHEFVTDKSTLKKDGRYENLDFIKSNEVPQPKIESVFENQTFNFKDEARQKIVVDEYWGYWDIDGNGIVKPFVAAFVGDVLIRLEESPFPHNKIPFVIVPYLPVKNSVFGEPDGELLADNQKIIGAITRGMIDTIGRTANGQLAIVQQALDMVNLRKFERGEDFFVNPLVDPRAAFHTISFPEIPRSAYELLSLQNNEAESLTGIKAFNQGMTGDSLGTSVGGIRSALDAASRRELGILRRLVSGLTKIARMIISMDAVWLSDEEIKQLTDEDVINFRRNTLNAEFNVKVDITTPEVEEKKASEISFMLQTMGNNLPFEIVSFMLVEFCKLRKMYRLADMIQNYKKEPNPVEQKMQELSLAKLEAEVFNEQNKALENKVDAELKQARTQAELAKARKTQSSADLDDLDFIRKQKGQDFSEKMSVEAMKEMNKFNLKALSDNKFLNNKNRNNNENNVENINNNNIGGLNGEQ